MLTQEEKNSLITTSDKIKSIINNMIRVISELYYKKNAISQILVSRVNLNMTEIETQMAELNNIEPDLEKLKEKFGCILNIDSDISDAYKSFLQSEFIAYNWNNLNLTDDHNVNIVIEFLQRETTINVTPNDAYVLEYIQSILNFYINNFQQLKNKILTLNIFDKIKNIKGNIVMVGANGSGKSTFARQLQGKITPNSLTILSAQHLLFYSRPEALPASGNEIQKVRNYQMQLKMASDYNFIGDITSDLNQLINALLAQHIECAIKLQAGGEKEETLLEKTSKLWHELIAHRSLIFNGSSITVETPDKQMYPFNDLSDGEKAVFYYIGHILLASEKSYILIDEPENHLHLAICNKLWDKLESIRTDCSFIYLTHNLDFAMSRTNSTTIWNKQFIAPAEWDFKILESDLVIPDGLLMEIAGSRKDICFCEGKNKDSLDYKLYSILLDDFTVIPAGGHREVIDYTNAYNKLPFFSRKAIGIIDGDCHLPKQIEKWKECKVYAIAVNEIENLLCDEIILQAAISQFCSGESAIDNFYTSFWKSYESDKEQQAIWYVNNYINNKFKENFLHEKGDLENLKMELCNITSPEEIERLYNERLKLISDIILQKNYALGICTANFKGKLTKCIAKNTIVDKYADRVIDLIKKDKELSKKIFDKYLSDFIYI